MAASGRDKPHSSLSGVLLDEEGFLSLADMARACAVHADYIIELVEEGVIEGQGKAPLEWRFGSVCLRKARKAVRLQRDLGVNIPGIALALQLLDELEALQEQLAHLPRDLL